jgi:hypothetical protein
LMLSDACTCILYRLCCGDGAIGLGNNIVDQYNDEPRMEHDTSE